MMTKHTVLLVDGLKLAPRPGSFAILDFNKMDVLLIGCELTSFLDPADRLVLLLRAPHPLNSLPYF